MLQFAEDFFQHEIRENFYIDSTMKTVWAAALDVLQSIAEVCEKYGLEWYAAYGTLLGAIRHEGYIPWDDDMDIWMKRDDYQKLLEVLPGELPEEYSVLSPQTETGYEQFHTCVVCGEGISIEPQYLERHYGCPFRVGVDIFPLDYLPRDERLCQHQKSIFLLAKRIAQTVQEYRQLPEFCKVQRDASMKEILEGIGYLKEYCGYTVKRQLLEQGQWDKVISDVYRIANEVIRHCPEQDADYLVMYRDYANAERKVFPKEWFDETWGATFENLMMPIPWKYDEILRRIYGDYQVRYRNSTCHEYPYYESQLENLREMVRQRVKSGDGAVDEGIFPAEWKNLLIQANGHRKNIVLYTNDISDFIAYGEEALEKLKSVLRVFYEAKEQILLWWRPQRDMAGALTLAERRAEKTERQKDESDGQAAESDAQAAIPQARGADKPKADVSLAERYNDILKQYKTAAWGICDESTDKLRAVKLCDAYYGARNNMVRKLQDMGKPVMIAEEK